MGWTLLRWLRPNALGAIFFVPCAMLAQFWPILWPIRAAFDGLVVVAGVGITIAIFDALSSIVVPYVVAMPLGRRLGRATRPSGGDVWLAVLGTTAAALLAGIVVSKQYWGYYFRRPPLDERVAGARQVRSVTLVGPEQGAGGDWRFVVDPDSSLDDAIRLGRQYPYDMPHYRSLVALADRRLLASPPPTAQPATLAAASAALGGTGLLVPGEPGYPCARHLHGVLLEFEDDRGEALAFLGVGTGAVSNDHHAYYELVFSVPPAGDGPRVRSAVRFYYDVAGIEGVEWWVMWLAFTVLGSAITVPATVTLRALVRRRRGQRRYIAGSA